MAECSVLPDPVRPRDSPGFASRRPPPANGRPLSISVPPTAPFIPSLSSSSSSSSRLLRPPPAPREEESDMWESDMEEPARRSAVAVSELDDDEQHPGRSADADPPGRRASSAGLASRWRERTARPTLGEGRSSERRFRYPRGAVLPAHAADDDSPTDMPSTPVTLPPASLTSSSPSSFSEILDPEDDPAAGSPGNPFPSSDEGAIGLGVDSATIARHASRAFARSIEGMHDRALLQHHGVPADGGPVSEEGLGEDDDDDDVWKDAVLRNDDLAVPPPVVDLGVGGSSGSSPQLPFPAYHPSPSSVSLARRDPTLDRELPPLPSNARSLAPTVGPDGVRSPRNSTGSTSTASRTSNSSTLSLPSATPVDLTLPNRTAGSGPFMSVANGPMARVAMDGNPRQSPSQRGARGFFSSLLSRSPRSPASSFPSASPALGSGPSRSPSAPLGFASPLLSAQRQASHSRSSSLPSSAPSRTGFSESRTSLSSAPDRISPQSTSRPPTPRVPLAHTPSSPLSTSASAPLPLSSYLPAQFPSSPSLGSVGHTPSSTPLPPPPTLQSVGLSLVPLTLPLSLSRHNQPLCGALLDDKYILIGTTGGLDFLPIPLPGSLPMVSHGKKRRETRKPIALIKRTRFKDLAILSERSNILLAIAGRNDHIRVYALDGIRAMIEKKMAELDIRDGYPIIPDPSLLRDPKGKARAEPVFTPRPAVPLSAPAPSSLSTSAFQFSEPSPPPGYSPNPPSPRRRPPPSPTSASFLRPTTPVRSTSRNLTAASNIVRAVPTNPRTAMSRASASGPASPRTLRGQKSREFVASRRGSTAVIPKRRSNIDASGGSGSGSPRGSVHSADDQAAAAEVANSVDDGEDDVEATGVHPAAPSPDLERRFSTTSTSGSGWATTPSTSPVLSRSVPRMEARPPGGEGLNLSAALDLADLLGTTGPDDHEPPLPSGTTPSASMGDVSPVPSVAQRNRTTLNSAANKPRPLPRDATVASDHAAVLEFANLPRRGPPDERRGSVSAKLEPRAPTLPPLRSFERSPTMELASLLRETGPPPPRWGWRNAGDAVGSSASSRAPGAAVFDTFPRSASDPTGGLNTSSRPLSFSNPVALGPATMTSTPPTTFGKGKAPECPPTALGDARASLDPTNTGPTPLGGSELRRSVSARARLVARNPTGRRDDMEEELTDADRAGTTRRGDTDMTLAEAIRNGPPPELEGSLGGSPSMSSLNSSPGTRSSKRWTMAGMGPKFLRVGDTPPTTSSESSRRGSSDTRRTSLQLDRTAEPDAPSSGPATPPPPPPPPVPSRSIPLPPHDFKRPAAPFQTERPVLPASSQVPPDAHPASSSSPLEYVKLARTKGALLLRAVETKKRTYLAVLCGDEGERIELFTGSRSISLSLNRTFVLPEHPRTIEFQIQGDDLIDIYLVYSESVFALEPATVRVREVGVGRGERRARRDAERRMRQATSATVDPGATVETGAPSSLHPADPALSGTPRTLSPTEGDESNSEVDPLASLLDRAPAVVASGAPFSSIGDSDDPPEPPPRSASSYHPPPSGRSQSPDGAESQPVVRSKLPYSTFQQLPFVPPVPSSVLASAWIIPPLYTDVVAGHTPPMPAFVHPFITVTDDVESHSQGPPAFQDFPLLSPISLLGGAAQRANGPPGLFFVTKGKNLSGIVTGDGRSVIKKPLVWNPQNPTEGEANSDAYRRVEMIIVGGTRTIVVGVGATEVKAIAVGGDAGDSPFGTAISVTPTSHSKSHEAREVEFLGNHTKTNQLFFTERLGGQSWRCWCLGAA